VDSSFLVNWVPQAGSIVMPDAVILPRRADGTLSTTEATEPFFLFQAAGFALPPSVCFVVTSFSPSLNHYQCGVLDFTLLSPPQLLRSVGEAPP
jgi:hypothetical protein